MLRLTLFILVLAASLAPAATFAQEVTAESLLREARSETPAGKSAPADGAAAKSAASDAAAPAAPAKSDAPAPADPAGSAPVLIFGVILVALGGWGVVKFRNGKSPSASRALRHVQSLKLGPKHQISLVDVEGRRLVIGLTEGAITLLTETAARPESDDDEDVFETNDGTWVDVFESARKKIETEADFFETDGALEPESAPMRDTAKVTGLKAYDAARTSSPRRARETDSVVVALEKLERRGGNR